MTVVSQPNGDYESIKRIESMDAEGIRLRYVSEAPNRDLFARPMLAETCGAAAGGDGAGGAGGAGPSALERALAETGRADIYSIYFSFNSDAILEESEPTLEEIAELMRKHQDWRLSLNGHTDKIASDSYNLDLSRRRANATMRELVERYGIAAHRLTAAGSGESSPIDTNETLEGRARNRRVELVRLP